MNGTAGMPLDCVKLKRRLSSPAAGLVAGLVLAVVLMLLPAPWTAAIKGHAAAWLRLGQAGVMCLREHGSRIAGQIERHFDTARKLAQAERERRRLVEENRRLAAELAAARSQMSRPEEDPDQDPSRRLLNARWVKARVLGQCARAFLDRQYLLDAGTEAGVQPDAPVIDAPPALLDQGRDAGLKAGQLVLGQGRIFGKIVQVGRWTSVVRTVTEPGYRDLVCLGESGPQGVLEGAGEPLARVRLVEVTEPAAVGDGVYSPAGKGVLAEPLLYGRVVRVERPVGAAHWEIWMEPAADPHRTEDVAVLRVELNPLRVAAGKAWRVESGEW
jgi:hypothetical protein